VAGTAARETLEGVPVERFRYLWPESLERVAYDSGMMANLRQRWSARLGLPFLLAAFWLRAGALARRSDVLHAHWAPTALIALTSWARRPVVVTVWGSDVALLRMPVRGPLVRWILGRAASVIAVSGAMARELVALGLPAEKVTVVLTAIDALERRAPRAPSCARSWACRTTGRWRCSWPPVAGEGPRRAAGAARLVRERMPLAAFVLTGEGQLRGPLEERCARARPSRARLLRGRRPRERGRVPGRLRRAGAAQPLRRAAARRAGGDGVRAARGGQRRGRRARGGAGRRHGRAGAAGGSARLAGGLERLLGIPSCASAAAPPASAAFERREHTWTRVARDLDTLYAAATS
jgi:hypothetical protein